MSEAGQENRRRRISSPEELRAYLHVTSPRLWITLGAIVVLLAALIVGASTIRLENTLKCQVEVGAETDRENQPINYYWVELQPEQRDLVKTGMEVRFGGITGKVAVIFEDEEEVDAILQSDQDNGTLAEGTYEGEIVLEVTSPIDFLLNVKL